MTRPIHASKLAAACALLALAGCAAFGPSTPEEQVKARAQERRDAIVRGDHRRVYEYMTPGYRGVVSGETYAKSIGTAVIVVGASVESVQCETLEKCIANVKVEIKPLAVRSFTGTITTYTNETWLMEAGQWWYFENL